MMARVSFDTGPTVTLDSVTMKGSQLSSNDNDKDGNDKDNDNDNDNDDDDDDDNDLLRPLHQ